MAKLVGARLARSGAAAVTIAGTWRAAIAAIAARGVVVEDGGGTWSASVAAVMDVAAVAGRYDLVLVLVKSYQTGAVAPVAARSVAAGGLIVTLQNGLGNREALRAAADATGAAGRVAVGVTSAGATGIGPERVRAGGPGLTVLGLEPATSERVKGVALLFRLAGLETETAADIDRIIWRKLAVNCAINPLTSIHRVPNGRLLDIPAAREIMVAAAREVAAVAAARGIDVGTDVAALAIEVAERTAGNRSSMLQDVARGARTEVDAINGAVVREGRRMGVPTPVNARLWRAVARLDQRISAAAARSAPSLASV